MRLCPLLGSEFVSAVDRWLECRMRELTPPAAEGLKIDEIKNSGVSLERLEIVLNLC